MIAFLQRRPIMQIYYPDLRAIDQQTRQLEHQHCRHCQHRQLVSHGFIYKKRVGATLEAVGKRVFCSNRGRRTGCGRTMRLYLDSALHRLHYAASHLLAFVFALLAGMPVQQAYRHATGCPEPRHAWRWLHRLRQQLPSYRSLQLSPLLPAAPTASCARRPPWHALLSSTFSWLQQHFTAPLCATFQRQLQRPFLP